MSAAAATVTGPWLLHGTRKRRVGDSEDERPVGDAVAVHHVGADRHGGGGGTDSDVAHLEAECP